jgi:hypothetical protein
MIKARNVKWGMVVADVLRAIFASPGDPISLDEYSNSPREAASSGNWAGFEVQIVSQMSETKTNDMRGRPVSSLFKNCSMASDFARI